MTRSAAGEQQAGDDWAAVAAAINARVAALRMTQLDLAARSGVSPATIREIQHNQRPRRRYGRTLAALSEALDWPANHLDTVLNGQAPAGSPEGTPGDDPVLEQLHALRAELVEVKQRLADLENAVGKLPGER